MQAHIQKLQCELSEMHQVLASLVDAISFIQGFVESDYGMRFQFQAYKSTYSNAKVVTSSLESLRNKYSTLRSVDRETNFETRGAPVHHFIPFEDTPVNHSRSHTSRNYDNPDYLQISSDSTVYDQANSQECYAHDTDDHDTGNEHPSGASLATTKEAFDSILVVSKQKKRKRGVVDKNNWSREVAKIRRMRGEAYIGHTKIERGDDKRCQAQVKPISSRKLGPSCKSSACTKSTLRHCNSFPEKVREALFQQFWHKMDWEQKKTFVCSYVERDFPRCVSITGKARKRNRELIRYFLPLGGEKKQVCMNMFMNTLSVRQHMICGWVKKALSLPEEKPEPYIPKRKNKKNSKRLSLKDDPEQKRSSDPISPTFKRT